MAKRTAIIDIGSNSARMAIYEKSSRFAFHLVKEVKSRVRIGEGAYENGGQLQDFAIKRAIDALNDFSQIAKNLQCKKIICVATSAVRDAPNANVFVGEVKKRLDIKVRIIDGNKEAYYGALAVINMLPKLNDAITVDIGGGSTELVKIKNGSIAKTISLDIGTVRLKELFFDNKKLGDEVNKFILKKLSLLDKDFCANTIIGIGGTTRALGKLFMSKTNYPLSIIHGFEYSTKSSLDLIRKIASSSVLNLKSIGIKKDRYDTIREGCAIFGKLIEKFDAKKIITSGVGIREGVYLSDILRSSGGKFPENFNLSLESLKTRFSPNKQESSFITKTSKELFLKLKPLHKLSDDFLYPLITAAQLACIGRSLGFYQEHLHSAYFVLNSLNYGFTHKDKVLISTIIKFHNKKVSENDIHQYKELLPSIKEISWLVFILSFAKLLFANGAFEDIKFELEGNFFHVICPKPLYLVKSAIKNINKPESFAIVL
ncbi:MAG: Ppx/GppA family phosphatase [Campylobacteraceae bacterium]|jgi:exopolyphosphatase/guanosine-5'-triphosphate,3'-diphosphate pyrophosphatase|nr:Ppx/GppA family phosphatase [Campylobacteraceae bacterium]